MAGYPLSIFTCGRRIIIINVCAMYFKYLLCCCSKPHESDSVPAETVVHKGNESSHLQLLDQGVSGVQGSVSMDEGSVNTAALNVQERSSDSIIPRLEIKVLDGTLLAPGQTFKVSGSGLEGSIRGVNDGEVYFGGVAKVKDVVVNDYVLPNEEGVGNRHFLLKYQALERKYTIRDLGEGTGTFIKITTKLLLKDNYILSFGENHMVVQHCEIIGQEQPKITLKFIDGSKSDEVFQFQSSDSPVRIGRQGDCQIKFEDNSLSRYQCLMTYVAGAGWHLQDGDGRKNSTNGTWLFADFAFEIFDHMVFKAGQSLFEVTVL